LILKEAYGKQVGFELIFRMFDGFLIGGEAETITIRKPITIETTKTIAAGRLYPKMPDTSGECAR
jgi:hypothetical protein